MNDKAYICAKCCQCEEPAAYWWPAYDPQQDAKPYCQKHMDEAKRVIPTNPPAFLKMSGYYDKR